MMTPRGCQQYFCTNCSQVSKGSVEYLAQQMTSRPKQNMANFGQESQKQSFVGNEGSYLLLVNLSVLPILKQPGKKFFLTRWE